MISSRTPEGDPNCCPLCGKRTTTEPSTVPLRDAPCPHCGSLLWFANLPAKAEPVHLAEEMAALSAAKLRPAQYYAAFLQRLLAAIAAPAGGVWTITADEGWRLVKHTNMHKIGLRRGERSQEMHDELLREAFKRGQPGLLWPKSTIETLLPQRPPAGNPTDYTLLLAPMLDEKKVIGIIEVWQDPQRGPDAQRGFLQFLVRMASYASDYARKAEVG